MARINRIRAITFWRSSIHTFVIIPALCFLTLGRLWPSTLH
jgi:hypothetical protein